MSSQGRTRSRPRRQQPPTLGEVALGDADRGGDDAADEAPADTSAAVDDHLDSAGLLKHDWLAQEAIRAMFEASGDKPDHGRMKAALSLAGKLLTASWYRYRDQYGVPPEGQESPEADADRPAEADAA